MPVAAAARRRLRALERHVAPDSAAAGEEESASKPPRSTAATLLSFPVCLAGISLEQALASRGLWPRLRFPRSPAEIADDPQRFFELVRDHQLPWGEAAALLPAGCELAELSQLDGQTTEPDKNAVNTGLRLRYAAAGGAAGASGAVDVFVKYQCGRELQLLLQAIRNAAAPDACHREVRFYQRLAHRVPQRVARPYFADAVHWCNRVCLVLEHLGDMEVVTDWQGGTQEQLEAVAVSVAGMHAGWWGRTAVDEGTAWIPARQGLDYANFVDGFIKKEPDWYKEIWAKLQDYFAALPVTLVHGDCRLGNMMFPHPSERTDGAAEGAAGVEEDGEAPLEVVFSDWEATNVGPALWDIAYMSTLSQEAEERRVRKPRMLELYLEALAEGGVVVGMDAAIEQLGLLQLVLFFVSSSVAKNALWSGHGNTTKDGRAWGWRVAQAVIDITETEEARSTLALALDLPVGHFEGLCTVCREGLKEALHLEQEEGTEHAP